MDYLEGFLIGPIWSDTDYETRRHVAIHIFSSALVAVFYIFLQIFPHYQEIMNIIPLPHSLVVFVTLVLICPLIACFYYRLPVFVRPVVLFTYAAKFFLAAWVLIQYTLPLYSFESGNVQEYLFEEVNKSIETGINWFDFLGYLFSMILGIIAGGLWVVLRLALVLQLLIAVPLALLLLLKLVQYGLDLLVSKFFTTE